MHISVFELFKIGIGPSSSHTVGPMRAARQFVEFLEDSSVLSNTWRVTIDLYGSLGATGRGHQSDKAVLMGLTGKHPETVEIEKIPSELNSIRSDKTILLGGTKNIGFKDDKDLKFRGKSLPHHPNGMIFSAYDQDGDLQCSKTYYSIGGGFILEESDLTGVIQVDERPEVPFPFGTCEEILTWCEKKRINFSDLMLANESARLKTQKVQDKLWRIWEVMEASINKGLHSEGYLPGDLSVKRRAPDLFKSLSETEDTADPLLAMDWVNLFAIAVNEVNAAGGRIVTAPTNGAAGIVPSVLMYWTRFGNRGDYTDIKEAVARFLLTAGAIGALYKKNASISGAELGCQGEVGVACSMAAGALAELWGGTPWQVENAAEIGMEHNLGLTCDPVGGLVQIPCIERNAMGAVKAINAARMALRGDGYHYVSLDKVIKTMKETGKDMKSKYKETSRGGLAVNVIEC